MKKSEKKLKLRRETITQMTSFNLLNGKGGFIPLEEYDNGDGGGGGGTSNIITQCGCPRSYPRNCCDNV